MFLKKCSIRIVLILILLSLAPLAISCIEKNITDKHEELVHYEGGLVGYINREGRMVIEPQFDHASSFSEGLASVLFQEHWGYISQTGEFTIEPRFYKAKYFSGGLAAVAVMDTNLWGYIDKTGAFVIEPQLYDAQSFSDGLARVSEKGGKYGYINRTGDYAIEPRFDIARDFSEGLARAGMGPVSVETPRGFINCYGEYVIQPELVGIDASDNRADFFEGKALFAQKEWQGDYLNITYGFIDKTGAIVIEPIYHFADHFSEGFATVNVDGKWGYIDSVGNIFIEPQYEEAGIFSEGLAAVRVGEKWGYIDKNGNVIIEPQYADAGDFSEGMAWIAY